MSSSGKSSDNTKAPKGAHKVHQVEKKKQSSSAQKFVHSKQKVLARESHDVHLKRSSGSKTRRKADKHSAKHSEATIKKKDIQQQNKEAIVTLKESDQKGKSLTKDEKDKIIKDAFCKIKACSSAFQEKVAKDLREKIKEKPSNDSGNQQVSHRIFNEKISKDRLDKYLSYITEKLSRPKGQEPTICKRHENCFKSPEMITTISQQIGKKTSSTSLRCSNKSVGSTKSSVMSTMSRKSQASIRRKRTNKTAIEIAKRIVSASPHPPVVETPKPASKSAVVPSIVLSPYSVERKNSLHEKVSKYKRMKYQTGEELLKFYKDRVDKAVRDRKTFTVCGNFWSVRKALLARGWVEKIHHSYYQPERDIIRKLMAQGINELVENVHDKQHGAVHKRVILSKMLGRHQVDLFWDYGCDPYKLNPDNVKLTIINNIRKGLCSYSTKQGLCEIMKRSHWYNYPGISNIRHPRSYTLTENGDPDEFVRDFRITAAMSMLKWIVHTGDNSVGKVFSEAGKVPIKNFHFALSACDKYIQRSKHEDIDYAIEEAPEFEWNNFLENYYRCVHVGNHFKSSDLETEQSVIHKSKIMLNKLKKVWLCLDMDGHMNIWILKPTAGSRGIGIHICRTLAYVLRVVSERKTIKYVIQKYIERPLLIYNTKFDIRQWFLISSTNPLTIWIYKSCYLRFSSQTYNLRKLHESIHLTNNSVQCKYKNTNRDPALPEYNMWDSDRFTTYLETIGYPNVFKEIIYPGMKECIAGAILIHQDYINTRKNCFELYGADFMLTEDFKPWLIEINSRPALYASTPITAKMCPQVLEDVVKVIIDNARNCHASTGQFELLYREKQQNLPPNDASALQIRGIPLSHEYFYTPTHAGDNKQQKFPKLSGKNNKSLKSLLPERQSSDFVNINNTQNYMKYVSNQMKKTLMKLLDIIQKERERRRKLKTSKAAVGTGRIPQALKPDCIKYVEKINTVNNNLKELQEIFKPRFLSDQKLKDIAQTLEPVTSSDKFCLSEDSSDEKLVYLETILAEKDTNTKCNNKCKTATVNHSAKPQQSNNKCQSENVKHPIIKYAEPQTKNIQSKLLYEIPKETAEELRRHSQKLEDALSKVPSDNGESKSLIGDLFKYLNIFQSKDNSPRPSTPKVTDDKT